MLGAAWIPMFFFLNLYLQQVLGLGAFASGAALLPLTVTIMVGMVAVAPRLIARLRLRRSMTVAGLATLAGGLVWLSFIGADGSVFVADVLPATLVTAAGMAMAFIPSLGMALSSAAPEEGGLAAGIVNTNYQVGSALGLALMTALATTMGLADLGNVAGLTHGFSRPAWAPPPSLRWAAFSPPSPCADHPARPSRAAMNKRRPANSTTTVVRSGASNGTIDALQLRRLAKRFGDRQAVAPFRLTVHRGTTYGLIGPNGAGKSTLLSMAVGLLRPDSGSSTVFGADVWTDRTRALTAMGVLPDGLALPERLTGPELLGHVGRLRRLPAEVLRDRIEDLLDVMGLADGQSTLVIDYSTGMRKKLGLALALLHAPALLVLDEPLEALDPVSAVTVTAVLRSYVAGGGAVLLSSHDLNLVADLCDRVAVMAAGRLVADGTVASVLGQQSLQEAFVGLVGEVTGHRELEWLRTSLR